MIANTIKDILTLVPEAQEFVKKASLTEELPMNNADSCVASALTMKYHECVDHAPIDVFAIEKVAQAAALYNVSDICRNLSDKLIKAAEHRRTRVPKEDSYLSKQASFEVEVSDGKKLVALSDKAAQLYKQASELGVKPSETVSLYSGNAVLVKSAAIAALADRFKATDNAVFVKLANAVYHLDAYSVKPETLRDLATTVSKMDEEEQLSGFNFFKEAMQVKEAKSVLEVTLCGQKYPYESIAKLGKDRISQYIGKDVAGHFDSNPAEFKQILETLPRDLQTILCRLLKNV